MDRLGTVAAAAGELGFGVRRCHGWARGAGLAVPGPGTGARGRRNTKYTQEQRDRFLAVLARVGSVSVAARELGLKRDTAKYWAARAGIASVRPGTGRREEFLRLRACGSTRREAAKAVGVGATTAADWDAGIRRSNGRRFHPDGSSADYKQGVSTHVPSNGPAAGAPAAGLAALQAPISGRYLSLPERERIRDLLGAGKSVRTIARDLGRAPSSISREIARNGTGDGYLPYAAQRAAVARRPRPKASKMAAEGPLRDYVDRHLSVRWSPGQISNRLVQEFPENPEMRVSPETIYQALYVQARGGLKREVAAALRTGRARRKPRRDPAQRTHRFADPMVMISERPPEIEDRAVPGHWEGDLITGAHNRSAIATLVERTTRYVMLVHLPAGDHGAEAVRDGLTRTMGTLPAHLRGSLTWDQGAEMAGHKAFSLATDIDVYFCDPASPWQRGSNENTNGLLRQYFPKGTDLSAYGPEDLEHVAQELNGRPRKTLGWDTPAERLRDLLLTA